MKWSGDKDQMLHKANVLNKVTTDNCKNGVCFVVNVDTCSSRKLIWLIDASEGVFTAF